MCLHTGPCVLCERTVVSDKALCVVLYTFTACLWIHPTQCCVVFAPSGSIACAVLGSGALGDLIRDRVAAQISTVADFVSATDTLVWYLDQVEGSGVLAGRVPVDPVCLGSGTLHFDLSLSDNVVNDGPHDDLMRELRSQRHCSLISASGAGKTKAVLDLLKVCGVPHDAVVCGGAASNPPLSCRATRVTKTLHWSCSMHVVSLD